MQKKMVLVLSMAMAMLIGVAAAWAALPPPVPQTLGLPDTAYANFAAADCLVCHATTSAGVGIADRHHNLTLPVTMGGKNLSCSYCHKSVLNPATGLIEPIYTKDCLYCHNTGSPHHRSQAAANRDCAKCHGSFVDNYNDLHYIPSYGKTNVTPSPTGKVVPDLADPTKTTVVGGCAACHTASSTTTTTGKPIMANNATHHGTGIGQDVPAGATYTKIGDCTWCHNVTGTTATSEIRQCETCHGVKSLHSVQADSPNAASLNKIVTYQEDAGFGHIGNDWDCWGCHGWVDKYAGENPGATVPAVSGLSANTVRQGVVTYLSVNGSGLFNTDGVNTYNPVVTLTNGTTSITITPTSITSGQLQVTIPGTLLPGNYSLQVKKMNAYGQPVVSNDTNLSVVPQVTISTISSSRGVVTITGKGFGAPTGDFLKKFTVTVNGKAVKVLTWTDTKITVSATISKGATVVVNALFGSVTKKY